VGFDGNAVADGRTSEFGILASVRFDTPDINAALDKMRQGLDMIQEGYSELRFLGVCIGNDERKEEN